MDSIMTIKIKKGDFLSLKDFWDIVEVCFLFLLLTAGFLLCTLCFFFISIQLEQ